MRLLRDVKITNALRCPKCGERMRLAENGTASLVCYGERRHCYDLSASGYVNMCDPSQSGGGDSKGAVRARSEFLNQGYYEPAARVVCEAVKKYATDNALVVDAGCGEGYYSLFLAREGISVCGADLSKFAVDAASKRAGREGLDNAFFMSASVFELPIADGSADAVVNIFAPCAEKEYSRILRDGGVLVMAQAGETHLLGLKRAIYDNAWENTQRADAPRDMQRIFENRVSYEIELKSNEHIMALFSMTPYYFRTSQTDKKKLESLESLTTEVDIVVTVYKKINGKDVL